MLARTRLLFARIARINMYLQRRRRQWNYLMPTAWTNHSRVTNQTTREDIQNVRELREAIKGALEFDVALTNPPFSMSKELKNETERKLLKLTTSRKEMQEEGRACDRRCGLVSCSSNDIGMC